MLRSAYEHIYAFHVLYIILTSGFFAVQCAQNNHQQVKQSLKQQCLYRL